jgi:glutathione S-transferase
MHSGFTAMRSALPMNIKAHFSKFKIWSKAQADIERVTSIWRECLTTYGGPYLFGKNFCMADAMYAPVVTRFMTYDVPLDAACSAYAQQVMAHPAVSEWIADAKLEVDEIEELEVEF